MSSSLRIKIEYTDSRKQNSPSLKFIYVIDSPATTTIGKLITALQDFIVTQFGCYNIHLVHLVTDDGYLLMKHNICAHVLTNNEKLVCIDMNQFIAKNRSTLNTEEEWLILEEHDPSDNIKKSLTVGINDTGKLYIYLYGGKNMQELYLYNIFELLTIAHDKHNETNCLQMIIPKVSSSEWFIKALWMQDSISNNTLFLIGSLKTSDTENIRRDKLRIHLNESTKTIEKGEIISLSDHSKENTIEILAQTQTRLDELKNTIPSSIRAGPILDTKVPTVQKGKHECEGDSSIRMNQGKESIVEIEQELFARDGHFRNFTTITNIIISKKPTVLPEILMHKRSAPVEKPIAIAQVHVQYQWHDEKWLDCQDAKIEIESARQDDRRKLVSSILNIEPDKLVSVSIHAAIRVKGNPNRNNTTRSRAHRSLPQPLKLKIIVTDNQTKMCSLIVEQMNKPLELITKEIFLEQKENDIKELIAFVYADDCEYDERIYTVIYIDKNNCLIIGNMERYAFMDKTQIRTNQFNAKKNRKTEELIEFISNSNTKAISLFDPDSFLFYAIRIELTTTTSKTVETVLLPLNAIK